MDDYQPIIGMEIHVELKTNSKMFCGCKNDPFHAPKPNCYTCPVCLGMPGGLPVANKKAIEWAIKLGLALNCEIPLLSKFDRKNYFYPDLAKGYQISQYDQPLAINGWLEVETQSVMPNLDIRLSSVEAFRHPQSNEILKQVQDDKKRKCVRITRVHLEEDTGKLLHSRINGKPVSLIDFNRSGVPLVEIVTEPDIRSSEDARIFLKKLHQIIRYLDISDAEMEKGSMRLEPNISVGERGQGKGESEKIELPSYKVEVKNINSFNFVKKAIDYEVDRHSAILETGEFPVQETRGWDEKKNVTLPQRRKEAAADYRYFPDPDLPPLVWTQEYIAALKSQIPELPDAKTIRFVKEFGLPLQDAVRLTETRELAHYFEKTIMGEGERVKGKEISAKDIANWIINKKIDINQVSPEELLKTITAAKTKVVIDPHELDRSIETVIANNPKPVADYKNGKTGVIMFLVGMVMKELKGNGDAREIRSRLEAKLQTLSE
jgi:aspartyl-tRNA(Asn)/glutamyl-tRNA(Gln) amidotransferase subunit B